MITTFQWHAQTFRCWIQFPLSTNISKNWGTDKKRMQWSWRVHASPVKSLRSTVWTIFSGATLLAYRRSLWLTTVRKESVSAVTISKTLLYCKCNTEEELRLANSVRLQKRILAEIGAICDLIDTSKLTEARQIF